MRIVVRYHTSNFFDWLMHFKWDSVEILRFFELFHVVNGQILHHVFYHIRTSIRSFSDDLSLLKLVLQDINLRAVVSMNLLGSSFLHYTHDRTSFSCLDVQMSFFRRLGYPLLRIKGIALFSKALRLGLIRTSRLS